MIIRYSLQGLDSGGGESYQFIYRYTDDKNDEIYVFFKSQNVEIEVTYTDEPQRQSIYIKFSLI